MSAFHLQQTPGPTGWANFLQFNRIELPPPIHEADLPGAEKKLPAPKNILTVCDTYC
jgi:hypothetical protein